ncbi:MAG TPA: response regulator transcription factor [Dehalococcoidia bacterium]|nr:response regulator transcription factor [Dehalococcoidia bacterium]
MPSQGRSTHVLLISEQVLFRQALARVLTQEEPAFQISEAFGAQDALQQMTAVPQDIVLLHLGNPVSTGMHTLHELQAKVPTTRVIVLLDVVDDALMTVAIQSGAAGCVDASVDVTRLLQELRDAANGEIALSKGLVKLIATMMARGNGSRLDDHHMILEAPTQRERKVLELLSMGMTNNAIASHMALSESTVRSHVRAISQKLGAQNRVQAVARALALGIISSSTAGEEFPSCY